MSGPMVWRIAHNAHIAHAYDASRPSPPRSGPRSICARYPMRLREWWFELDVHEQGAIQAMRHYYVDACFSCLLLVNVGAS